MLWCNTPVTIESPKIPKASGKLPENFPLRIGVGAVQVQEFGPVMYCFAFQGPPSLRFPPGPPPEQHLQQGSMLSASLLKQ
jgi:hypothetical protein